MARRAVPAVSQKSLTATLRRLERNVIVQRLAIDARPVAVEYRITALGKTLRTPVDILWEWADAQLPQIEHARAEFDSRSERTPRNRPKMEQNPRLPGAPPFTMSRDIIFVDLAGFEPATFSCEIGLGYVGLQQPLGARASQTCSTCATYDNGRIRGAQGWHASHRASGLICAEDGSADAPARGRDVVRQPTGRGHPALRARSRHSAESLSTTATPSPA